MFSVSPRPEFDRQGGADVCEKQQDFLDYKFDMVIPLSKPEELTIHSAVLKGTGILKMYPKLIREKKIREEKYTGTPNIPVVDPKSRAVVVDANQQPVMHNEGVENFLRAYPEARSEQKYAPYIKRLSEGKDIHIVVEYKETTYNDPMPQNVDLKNFYVRRNVEGYEGLKTTLLTVEKIPFTWRELKAEEANGNFFDVDELMYEKEKADESDKREAKKGYKNKTYDILECVFWTRLKNVEGVDPEEDIKCVFWIAEDRKHMIGAIVYPFYYFDAYYIPHYIKNKVAGFYQPGIGEDMTDSNIAENAILNFSLEGAWLSNTVTPITEDPKVVTQFLEKRWGHGIPLKTSPDKIDFLNAKMPRFDAGGLIQLVEYLIKGDDIATGVTEGFSTGKADPVDPSAPGNKTIALLQRSGANVKNYITTILPSFNKIGEITLMLYAQMTEESQKYSVSPDRVVGSNPFKEIKRSDMLARTNLQSRAMTFSPDKLAEKREDLALLQTLRPEPLIARNPHAVYAILKDIVKSWSPKWRNRVDAILPPIEQFQQQMETMAVQAVAAYVQQVMKEAKVSGLEPEFNPEKLMLVVQDYLAQQVNPVSPEVAKAEMKRQGGA